jgi:SAM-dependent methyltransferase
VPLPSEIYDRDYFLSERCEGFDRFAEDRGLSPLKLRELDLLEVVAGHSVLDAGCGRGEVLLACAHRGAAVTGVDYADAAVELSRETLAGIEAADVRRGDVTALEFDDASFDRILFGDVIEHLDPAQADLALREFHRVLRPGGKLVVHTAPNLLFLKVGWPVARLGMKALGRGDGADQLDAWIAESKQYHVNEQSVFSLRAAMRRAGYADVRAWIDPDVLRSGQHHLTEGVAQGGGVMGAAAKVISLRPFRTFFGNDVYATGFKT